MSADATTAEIAASLRRHARGEKLAPADLALIRGIIPDTGTVVRRVTSATYKLTLREYAERFIQLGMESQKDNERKLKHWIRHGRFGKHDEPRDPPDLPPFDTPDQLAAWWRRCMTYKPPDWMIAAEKDGAMKQTGHDPPEPESAPPKPDEKTAEAAAPNEEVTGYGDLEIEGEIANDFTVRILFGAAMDSKRRYEEARLAENWRQARIIRGELVDDVKALQRAQVDALKVLAAKGDYLRANETMQSLNALLAMQDTSFYNALEEAIRVASPQMEPDRRRNLALQFRDKVFEHFHRTDFAAAWTPQDHAA